MKNRKTNGMKWQEAQAAQEAAAAGGMANVPALPVPVAGVPVVPDAGAVQAVSGQVMPGEMMPGQQVMPPDAVSPLQTPQGAKVLPHYPASLVVYMFIHYAHTIIRLPIIRQVMMMVMMCNNIFHTILLF